jgi:hypothetical protein
MPTIIKVPLPGLDNVSVYVNVTHLLMPGVLYYCWCVVIGLLPVSFDNPEIVTGVLE